VPPMTMLFTIVSFGLRSVQSNPRQLRIPHCVRFRHCLLRTHCAVRSAYHKAAYFVRNALRSLSCAARTTKCVSSTQCLRRPQYGIRSLCVIPLTFEESRLAFPRTSRDTACHLSSTSSRARSTCSS
jgi:hypothetical protein